MTKNSETTVENTVTISDAGVDNSLGPALFQRDENGLLKNTQYEFNDDGSVNWRAMIKEEHLFPNKGWFESRKQEVPSSAEGLADHQLLIKLSGIKELAKLRGFNHISYRVEKCEQNHVAVNCSISFIPNYETDSTCVSYEDMANATLENTSSFATKFLETIACNRAFVRCVRNFLNVHIVGDDEIDKSNGKPMQAVAPSAGLTPSSILENQALTKLDCGSFDDFKQILRNWWQEKKYNNQEVGKWSSFEDVPAKEARVLLKLIND